MDFYYFKMVLEVYLCKKMQKKTNIYSICGKTIIVNTHFDPLS